MCLIIAKKKPRKATDAFIYQSQVLHTLVFYQQLAFYSGSSLASAEVFFHLARSRLFAADTLVLDAVQVWEIIGASYEHTPVQACQPWR